jgi:drug/metabolite transporter (DMT)-like permease
MTYIGEIAALASAGSWAIASTIFAVSVKAYTPIMLNFVKGLVSVLILFILMVLFNDELFPSSAESYMYYKLLLSGTIGIACGDTFYFYALEELGARRTILLETLAPPFTGIIAFVYYGNTISLTGWIGIGFTVSGIALVVRE